MKLTLDQRQNLDLLYWCIILASGGCIVAFGMEGLPVIIPVIPFIISIYLTYKNNKIAIAEMKEKKNETKKCN